MFTLHMQLRVHACMHDYFSQIPRVATLMISYDMGIQNLPDIRTYVRTSPYFWARSSPFRVYNYIRKIPLVHVITFVLLLS